VATLVGSPGVEFTNGGDAVNMNFELKTGRYVSRLRNPTPAKTCRMV
jgi:hypothetical protein